MNNLEKVSVIIPVYNSEKYLKECLESVLQQSYENIEIICIDDGSTDQSLSICKKFAEKFNNITLIESNHFGQSYARNLGLEKMTGKYVMFLDSDDLLIDKAISICVDKMNLDPSIDVLYFNAERFWNNSDKYIRIYNGMPYVPNNNSILRAEDEISATFTNCAWGCYKTEIIKNNKIKFLEGYRYEDWDFTTNYLLYSKKIYWFNTVLYKYRFNDESSSIRFSNSFIQLLEVYNFVRNRFIKHNLWNNYKAISYRKIIDYSINNFFDKVLPFADNEFINLYYNLTVKIIRQDAEALFCLNDDIKYTNTYLYNRLKTFLKKDYSNFDRYQVQLKARRKENLNKMHASLNFLKKPFLFFYLYIYHLFSFMYLLAKILLRKR